MEDENGVVVPETTEEVTPEVTEGEEETPDQLKARLAKAEELANNYKVRAEKAESKAKEQPPKETAPETGFSLKDALALQNAKVHEDDIDQVADYAKFKGITLAEALKDNVVKTMLATSEENRKTAEAANVSTARRGAAKVTDDTLLEKASKGDLPDSEAEIERLMRAKLAQK